MVLKATAACDQPVYRPVLPRVAIGNVNLLTVIAGGRALDEIVNRFRERLRRRLNVVSKSCTYFPARVIVYAIRTLVVTHASMCFLKPIYDSVCGRFHNLTYNGFLSYCVIRDPDLPHNKVLLIHLGI